MAVNLTIPSQADIHAVKGVQIGIASAGIRKAGNKDITVFQFAPDTAIAGVFTTNRFRAAPVQVCEAHLASDNDVRVMVVNTGNANAGTGEPGLIDARKTCTELAKL